MEVRLQGATQNRSMIIHLLPRCHHPAPIRSNDLLSVLIRGRSALVLNMDWLVRQQMAIDHAAHLTATYYQSLCPACRSRIPSDEPPSVSELLCWSRCSSQPNSAARVVFKYIRIYVGKKTHIPLNFLQRNCRKQPQILHRAEPTPHWEQVLPFVTSQKKCL